MFRKSRQSIKYLGLAVASSISSYVGISFLRTSKINAEENISSKDEKSVVIIGAGVMGLGTAFHLAERGYKVTVLEKGDSVANAASRENGGLLCPSMSASWADIKFDKKFRGELKSVKITWTSIMDPYFWGWSIWFLYNGLWPNKAENNHEAHRCMGRYSHECQQKLEEKYGEELNLGKVAHNSIKLIYDKDTLDYFLTTNQAKFWEKSGHPFSTLTPDECKQHIPILDTQAW